MGGSLNWETFLVETNMFCFIHVGYLIHLKVFFSFWKKEIPSWNLENIFLLPWCMFNSQWNHHLSHAWLISWNLYPQQIWPVPMQSRQFPCRKHTPKRLIKVSCGNTPPHPPPKKAWLPKPVSKNVVQNIINSDLIVVLKLAPSYSSTFIWKTLSSSKSVLSWVKVAY